MVMEYLPTFALRITQIRVNIPYMEHLGMFTHQIKNMRIPPLPWFKLLWIPCVLVQWYDMSRHLYKGCLRSMVLGAMACSWGFHVMYVVITNRTLCMAIHGYLSVARWQVGQRNFYIFVPASRVFTWPQTVINQSYWNYVTYISSVLQLSSWGPPTREAPKRTSSIAGILRRLTASAVDLVLGAKQ